MPNNTDEKLYNGFYVKEREAYDTYDSEGRVVPFVSAVLSESDVMYATHAAIAPTRRSVNSLSPYICLSDKLGNWLTIVPKPTHFIGYEFDIATLLGADLWQLGTALQTRIIQYNKAGITIDDSVQDEQAISETNPLVGVFRVALSEFEILPATHSYDVLLQVDEQAISETKRVLVERDDCKGVYVRWLNVLGSMDSWLFTDGQHTQNITDARRQVRDVDSVVEDWRELEGEVEIIRKESETEKIATAYTPDIAAFKRILVSPYVMRSAKAFEAITGISDILDGESSSIFPECDKKYQQVQIIPTTNSLLISQRGNLYEVQFTYVESIRERNQSN
jgi:hypothetical protein